MDRFSTARLSAERLRATHLDDLTALHQDEAVMRFVGGVRTPQSTAAYLETNLAYWDKRGFGLWIIRDESGRFIGRAGIRPLDVEGVEEIEVGYTFISDVWGKGYASEITAALIEIGFGEFQLGELGGDRGGGARRLTAGAGKGGVRLRARLHRLWRGGRALSPGR
jgi:RimJ/RimL family protein N-acetyltransferase